MNGARRLTRAERLSRGPFADAFGRVLRATRHARGMSQEDLAHAAQVDRTYPSMLESGIREPKISTFVRLADALGQSPQALLTETLAMHARLTARRTPGGVQASRAVEAPDAPSQHDARNPPQGTVRRVPPVTDPS